MNIIGPDALVFGVDDVDACGGYLVAYGLASVGDGRLIIAQTDKRVVAVNLADGKMAWETPFAPKAIERYLSIGVVSPIFRAYAVI